MLWPLLLVGAGLLAPFAGAAAALPAMKRLTLANPGVSEFTDEQLEAEPTLFLICLGFFLAPVPLLGGLAWLGWVLAT